jgi:hypothetical protein
MTAAKPTSEEAVVTALASKDELTKLEIATMTGLGRSTQATSPPSGPPPPSGSPLATRRTWAGR